MAVKLWLIRHGRTALNEAGKYQGRLDEGLSANGRAVLRRADFMPEHIYVSPAKRARETAAILFPGREQTVADDLREMDFGAFEGRSWREMEHDAAYRAWVDGGCLGRCPGGEDKDEYTARVCAAVAEMIKNESDCSDLAIVAHGGTQMAVLERWGVPAKAFYEWQLPCGCGYELEWDAGRQTLRVVREVSFNT